jgi:hypothetical protein
VNEIYTLNVYRHNRRWVFDDPERDLIKEPFVAGADTWFDVLLALTGHPQAKQVNVTFSLNPFPGYIFTLTREVDEFGGNWYIASGLEQVPMRGWLCAALYRYFPIAPEKIYVYAEAA